MKKKYFLILWVLVFVAFFAIIFFAGPYSLTYSEHWKTFFFDAGYFRACLSEVGGPALLLGDFIKQFFISPVVSALVYALVLTLVSVLVNRLMSRISGDSGLLLLSTLPSMSLVCLGFNTNYSQAGTAALLLVLAAACLQRLIQGGAARFVFTFLATAVLFYLAGPAALLFAGVMFLAELLDSPGRGIGYLLPVALAWLLAFVGIRIGKAGDFSQILFPTAYFTSGLKAGSVVWLPWIMLAVDVLLASLWRYVHVRKPGLVIMLLVLQAVVVGAFGVTQIPHYANKDNEFLKELSYRVYHEDWDGVLKRCSGTPMTNLLFQNHLNIALAEKGMLGDYVFRYPSFDIQSLYIQADSKNTFMYSLLSDDYFAMGHYAFSQRYAFEANESAGNYSPRLLQRLVLTNESLGYDEVASKYRNLLSKTIFYRRWAKTYEMPSVDRACAVPDNRFCGIKGLDDDLEQIVLANPDHAPSMQYLGALCLLYRDLPRFMKHLGVLKDAGVLPEVLPISFQEGVAMYANGNADILGRYNVTKEVLDRFEHYKQSPSSEKNSFWYFIQHKK